MASTCSSLLGPRPVPSFSPASYCQVHPYPPTSTTPRMPWQCWVSAGTASPRACASGTSGPLQLPWPLGCCGPHVSLPLSLSIATSSPHKGPPAAPVPSPSGLRPLHPLTFTDLWEGQPGSRTLDRVCRNVQVPQHLPELPPAQWWPRPLSACEWVGSKPGRAHPLPGCLSAGLEMGKQQGQPAPRPASTFYAPFVEWTSVACQGGAGGCPQFSRLPTSFSQHLAFDCSMLDTRLQHVTHMCGCQTQWEWPH